MKMTVHTTVRYEAAHQLTGVPDDHQCARMHGHSYALTISISRPVDLRTGFVIDFADVKKMAAPLLAQLDHHVINETVANPTVENQLFWWAAHLMSLTGLSRLHLQETDTNSATLDL